MMNKTVLANLIDRFCSGDKDLFPQIHDTYKARLWAFLCAKADNREDAEDLFNLVSLAVAQSLHRLKEPAKIAPWVIGIAANRLSDYYQKKRAEQVSVEDFVDELADPALSGEERVIHMQRMVQIRKCIRKLPGAHRQYFELQFLAEIPQKEIAEQFGINLNALKSYILRSKVKLTECLKRYGIAPLSQQEAKMRKVSGYSG